ncbi:MAG: RpiB/LacA/LacB family sugar-phosphate isomerase [Rickettsia endosymbiont of Labidopullus appendiculatus]|nr:RpiB/LacA/LacB family sugar-phosphate isomerase [Rickettsia endosymbiont of Labidopullus appendiculatus]
MSRKLVYASDYRGIELRKALIDQHNLSGFESEDLGIDDDSPLDYVDISRLLADRLRKTEDIGVMICGSGQEVAIALNRFTHIRAIISRSTEDSIQTIVDSGEVDARNDGATPISNRRATSDDVTNFSSIDYRQKLNANVLCLGSQNSSLEKFQDIIEKFVTENFTGEKHTACVQKLELSQTKHIDTGINVIVRGIIIHNNHILLTTATSDNPNFPPNIFFLPGGHVEYNEPSLQALKREIWEEMNLEIDESEFAGILECSWKRKGSIYHELNIVYNIHINGLDLSHPPVAMDHKFHSFIWKPIDQIGNIVILPESLKTIIKNYVEQGSKMDIFSQILNT